MASLYNFIDLAHNFIYLTIVNFLWKTVFDLSDFNTKKSNLKIMNDSFFLQLSCTNLIKAQKIIYIKSAAITIVLNMPYRTIISFFYCIVL